MKKRVFILTTCLAVMSIALLIWLYAIPALRSQTFYIAMVGPLSGDDAPRGQEMLNGINVYLKHALSDERLSGKKIRLLTFDDRGDEETALNIAREIAEDDRILLVLGHLQSSTSLVGGQIYKRERIPAITASAAADHITQGNEWYFRTTPNNSIQAEFTAQYIKFALHAETASMIYGSGSYDSLLKTPFEKTAERIGLNIQKKWRVNVGRSDMEKQLNGISRSLQKLEDPGVIFLAMPAPEAAQLIRMLRDAGKTYTFISSDTLPNSETFLQAFPAGQADSGNYSNGLYATSPFIYQIADPQAQAFKREYFEQYHETPSWIAASYYDAAAVAVEAMIQNGYELQREKYIRSDRKKIRQTLADLHNADDAVNGLTGKLYFDLNGDVNLPYSVERYERRQFLPAFTQYRVIEQQVEQDAQLFDRLMSGKIIMVNNRMVHRFQSIYTGMAIHDITQLDLKYSRYTVDFSLWFRFSPSKEYGGQSTPPGPGGHGQTPRLSSEFVSPHADIIFENAVAPIHLEQPVLVEHYPNGEALEVYRIQAEFTHHFNFETYPFDRHALPIQFHNKTLSRDLLIYVQDLAGVPEALKKLQPERNDIFSGRFDGWKVADIATRQDVMRINSTLGNPQFFATRPGINYSRLITEIHIQRKDMNFALMQFIPIVLVLVVVISMYFTPSDWLGFRAACFMAALLMTALVHTNFVSELSIFSLSFFEYILLGVYIAIAIAMYISITAYIFYTRRLDLLEQSLLFTSFSRKMKSRLSRKMRLYRLKHPNYTIIRQGERGDSLFMIIEGKVKVVVHEDGKLDEVNHFAAGEFFGELALLTGRERSADVITTSPAILGEITKDHLYPILKKHPRLVFSLSEALIQRKLLDRSDVPDQYTRDIQHFFGLPESK
ncbi:MAG: ABC transporter substrate-binding protein [bacterium]|nr:ABC transporter substrate-binding protein [bacterium]